MSAPINFSAQEPQVYGRAQRMSVPTPRMATYNAEQATKENRRQQRSANAAQKSQRIAAAGPQLRQYFTFQSPDQRAPLRTPQFSAPVSRASSALGSHLPFPSSMDSTTYIPSGPIPSGPMPSPDTVSPPVFEGNSQVTLAPELEPRDVFEDQDVFFRDEGSVFDQAERDEVLQDPDADVEEENERILTLRMDANLQQPDAYSEGSQITSTPVNLEQQSRRMRRIVQNSVPGHSTPVPQLAVYQAPAPVVPFATNPRRLVRRAHVSDANNEAPSSSPTPAPHAKRPITDVDGARDKRDDGPSDSEDDAALAGRAADLSPGLRRIFDAAVPIMRVNVIAAGPYMRGMELDQVAVSSWYQALKNLSETHGLVGSVAPTTDIINLLKQRSHQIKGKMKTAACDVVTWKKGYDLRTEDSAATVLHNRTLVAALLANNAFVYANVSDLTVPGSLYGHEVLQEVLNRTLFNDESKSDGIVAGVFFANGITLEALAFTATVVEYSIMEFQTGRREKSRMTTKIWQPKYEAHLKNLQNWKVYTTNSGSHLTQKLQASMIQQARNFAGIDVTPVGLEERMFSDDVFAANESRVLVETPNLIPGTSAPIPSGPAGDGAAPSDLRAMSVAESAAAPVPGAV